MKQTDEYVRFYALNSQKSPLMTNLIDRNLLIEQLQIR